ncbi:MAG: hypothetical protein ABSA17_06225 [Rhabdochlamydiaceae bacterium]|jgi:hypothetical protein
MTKITNYLSRILPKWVSFKLGQTPIERKTANAFFDYMAKKSSNPSDDSSKIFVYPDWLKQLENNPGQPVIISTLSNGTALKFDLEKWLESRSSQAGKKSSVASEGKVLKELSADPHGIHNLTIDPALSDKVGKCPVFQRMVRYPKNEFAMRIDVSELVKEYHSKKHQD